MAIPINNLEENTQYCIPADILYDLKNGRETFFENCKYNCKLMGTLNESNQLKAYVLKINDQMYEAKPNNKNNLELKLIKN